MDTENKTETTPPAESTPPTPLPTAAQPGATPPNTSFNDLIKMAKEKGDQTRSAPKSVDHLAKSFWKDSTWARQTVKGKLNTAYSVLTGLTHPEVRKEVKNYINKLNPPTTKK